MVISILRATSLTQSLLLNFSVSSELARAFKFSCLDFSKFFRIIASCCLVPPGAPYAAPILSPPLSHVAFPKKERKRGKKKPNPVEWMIWELKTSKWGGYILETAASITTFSLLSNIAVCWADSAPYLNLAAVP